MDRSPADFLLQAYLVELWPFAERARGISWFQLFGRAAGFFTTFVNPIGLQNAGWKYFIMYCCILVFEIAFVALFFPETSGRTLEELAFRMSLFFTLFWFSDMVFSDL